MACPQPGLGVEVLRVSPQLEQPFGLDPSGPPVGELDERLAAPQLPRLAGDEERPLRLAVGEQLPGPHEEVLELRVVQLLAVDGEAVPVGGGLDRLRTERLAQPRDAPLHDLLPAVRQVLPPQCLREGLGAAPSHPAVRRGRAGSPGHEG